MPAQNEDRDRQVVPRLRLSKSAIGRGELAPLKKHDVSPFSDEMVKTAVQDWEDSPGFSTAADLVSVAITLGRDSVAREAAEFIMRSTGPEAAKQLAARYLNEQHPHESPIQPTDRPSQHSLIHDIRMRLNAFPRNPVLWSDLAVAYILLGQNEKAKRAINISLALAPTNRFVIRTASRIYLHDGDGGRAHSILLRSPQLQSDPWLLSAEIATAQAAEVKSAWLKKGQKILVSSSLPPFHLSELASAVGTVIAKDGNTKAARKLVRSSLEVPTENATAQAAWLSRKIGHFEQLNATQADSFEAKCWLARERQDWQYACQEAKHWQSDQPFSSRPAIFGSYVASSFLHDYKLAIQMAKAGLICNPEDFTLYNNCAFALAQLGQPEEAAEVLQNNVIFRDLPPRDQVVFLATTGMIFFRASDTENGRKFYMMAVDLAKKNQESAEHIALAYFALEERRIGGDMAEVLVKQTIASAEKSADPVLKHLAERLRKNAK